MKEWEAKHGKNEIQARPPSSLLLLFSCYDVLLLVFPYRSDEHDPAIGDLNKGIGHILELVASGAAPGCGRRQ